MIKPDRSYFFGGLLLAAASVVFLPQNARAQSSLLQFKDTDCNELGQKVAIFNHACSVYRLTDHEIAEQLQAIRPGTSIYKNSYVSLRAALDQLDKLPACNR